MSEKLHQHHEKGPEAPSAEQEAKHNLERIHKAAEGSEKLPKAEQARQVAAKEAISGKDIAVEQKPSSETGSFGVEKQLKTKAYQKSMHRIQSQLSAPERAFSKFTHAKVVDKTSNIAAKTVARPNGILGGSICALLGSLFLLYASKHYGFSYNYLFFLVLFIGGYLIGSLLELAIWVVVGKRRQRLSS